MSSTDSPLKIFTRHFIKDVAAWLLKKNVLTAHELTTKLASEPLYADLLFELTLDDGQDVLLHLEFQGRSSKPSMPLRELLYLARHVHTLLLSVNALSDEIQLPKSIGKLCHVC